MTIVGYGAELQDGMLHIAGYRKTGRASTPRVLAA
jgi:hypothetical protein